MVATLSEQNLAMVEQEGIWTEEFHREKTMESRIYLKPGFVKNFGTCVDVFLRGCLV
jgi:hypothetical protein